MFMYSTLREELSPFPSTSAFRFACHFGRTTCIDVSPLSLALSRLDIPVVWKFTTCVKANGVRDRVSCVLDGDKITANFQCARETWRIHISNEYKLFMFCDLRNAIECVIHHLFVSTLFLFSLILVVRFGRFELASLGREHVWKCCRRISRGKSRINSIQ